MSAGKKVLGILKQTCAGFERALHTGHIALNPSPSPHDDDPSSYALTTAAGTLRSHPIPTIDSVKSPTISKIAMREDAPLMGDELADEVMLGHLLPVTCGHNGVLDHSEMAMYERHLLQAGLFVQQP